MTLIWLWRITIGWLLKSWKRRSCYYQGWRCIRVRNGEPSEMAFHAVFAFLCMYVDRSLGGREQLVLRISALERSHGSEHCPAIEAERENLALYDWYKSVDWRPRSDYGIVFPGKEADDQALKAWAGSIDDFQDHKMPEMLMRALAVRGSWWM